MTKRAITEITFFDAESKPTYSPMALVNANIIQVMSFGNRAAIESFWQDMLDVFAGNVDEALEHADAVIGLHNRKYSDILINHFREVAGE